MDASHNRLVCLALTCGLLLLRTIPAAARRDGIAVEGCGGCHQTAQEPTVRLTASPPNPALGQTVTVTLEISGAGGAVGGFYLKLDGSGSLQANGAELRSYGPAEIGHSAPKAASGGVARFQFTWTAPSSAGGVVMHAWAVSGNGDNTSRGDNAGEGELLLAYGCSGALYSADPDGDGFGAAEYGQRRDCSVPPGFAEQNGDCAEYNPEIHPGAAESCNRRDDDCDGQVDEGLPRGPQYPDADGDGYGSAAEPIVDCSSPKGYAPNPSDCDDRVATIHPAATEACNLADDDCDGRSDEGARAACGVGWCRRLSPACDPDLCTPGKPRAEMCNAFDDDCDDRLDEGAACAAGERCSEGVCKPADNTGSDAGASGANTPAGSLGGGDPGTGEGGAGGSGRSDRDACAASTAGSSCAGPPSASAAGGCSVTAWSPPTRRHRLALALALALLGCARPRGRSAKRRQRPG